MANDYRTVMLPTIDVIERHTFEYRTQYHDNGFASRGGFNWEFKYRLLPLLPTTIANPSKPFETPIMAGGLFAIHAAFFWELGGYDKGLNTYGMLNPFDVNTIFCANIFLMFMMQTPTNK